jgi:hypothetical protein
MVLVVGLAGLVVLMFIGGELGKRAEVALHAVPEEKTPEKVPTG